MHERPSVARVYDYLLGGKDNLGVDRALAERLRTIDPELPVSARVNRNFGARVVEWLARQGVEQYIDLGSGIPTTPPPLHEVAGRHVSQPKMVYVDSDPVVVTYSQALRSTRPGVVSIEADISSPRAVLADPDLNSRIDFARPVAILLFSVLQTVTDQHIARSVLRGFTDRMVPGSYLALSHVAPDRSDPDAVAEVHNALDEAGYPPVNWRSDAEIAELFDGFDLADPGLVDVREWRPDDDTDDPDLRVTLIGGVGRKR